MEFDKSVEDLFRFKMPQTKLTYAGGVDHIAAVREMIQARSRGGVLAQTRVVRNIVSEDLFL
ncbi:hypothetical protein D3C87_2016710 [compost metagenome]